MPALCLCPKFTSPKGLLTKDALAALSRRVHNLLETVTNSTGPANKDQKKHNRAGCHEDAHSDRVKPDPMTQDLVPSVCSWVVVEPRDVRSQGCVSLKGSQASISLFCASEPSRTAHSCPWKVVCSRCFQASAWGSLLLGDAD